MSVWGGEFTALRFVHSQVEVTANNRRGRRVWNWTSVKVLEDQQGQAQGRHVSPMQTIKHLHPTAFQNSYAWHHFSGHNMSSIIYLV